MSIPWTFFFFAVSLFVLLLSSVLRLNCSSKVSSNVLKCGLSGREWSGPNRLTLYIGCVCVGASDVLSGHSRYFRSSHWHSLDCRTLFAQLSFVLLVIRCIAIRANGRSLVWSFALLALVAVSSRDRRSRYWHSLQCMDTLRHLPAI